MTAITRRLAAVAFADVAGWSSLVEADELGALRAWNALRTDVVEPKILEHGGRLVDLAGDSVFAEFPSAVEAVSWALDLQRRPAGAELPGLPIRLRIGINVGDLLVDGARLVGDGVNVAARIHPLAAPGEIVVTDAVRQHVGHRISAVFNDLGEHQLKNIGRPIRVYRVEAEGPAAPGAAGLAGAYGRDLRALLALGLAQPAPGAGQGGDSAAAAELRALQEGIAQRLLPGSGGRVLRHDDSGLLTEFAEARSAVKAAFALQHAFGDMPWVAHGQALPRMAVQLGEPAAELADQHGGGADVAARLTAIAGPGELVVSSAVRNELTSVLDAEIEDLGECYLHDLNQPVRAFRLEPPGSRREPEPAGAAEELRPTLAVIPFAERGQGHDPLGEIMAEELIAALSRSTDLNVVSRLSTTEFRGRGASLADIGTHLRADYVLSGAYRVSLESLILTAELAETRSGRVAWAADLKGSVDGVIAGDDELFDRLVAEVGGAVIARELERTQSQSLKSMQTCTLLIGAIVLMHRLSPSDFHRARDMLQTVARRAPRHAVPQAWLAKWHVLRVWQGWSDDAAADTRLALDCGKRALDNDSRCSLALAVDGFVHTNLLKSLEVARERYDLALQVNPNDSLAWLLSGMLHAFKGEGKPALQATRHALRLSPLDPHRYFYDSLAASAELAAGHYERAIELSRRSLRANRMHASTYRVLAIAQWLGGQRDEARATAGELMRIEPQLTVSQWFDRSPSSAYAIGALCADALRCAGVPP